MHWPQWMHTLGLPAASKAMASTGQAAAHFPHWMHSDFFRMTPPPDLRWTRAAVGQALAQGAGFGAGRRVAGQTEDGLEAAGHAACRPDADSGGIPGHVFVDEPGTGQRAGMATDTAFHPHGAMDFHEWAPIGAFGQK